MSGPVFLSYPRRHGGFQSVIAAGECRATSRCQRVLACAWGAWTCAVSWCGLRAACVRVGACTWRGLGPRGAAVVAATLALYLVRTLCRPRTLPQPIPLTRTLPRSLALRSWTCSRRSPSSRPSRSTSRPSSWSARARDRPHIGRRRSCRSGGRTSRCAGTRRVGPSWRARSTAAWTVRADDARDAWTRWKWAALPRAVCRLCRDVHGILPRRPPTHPPLPPTYALPQPRATSRS